MPKPDAPLQSTTQTASLDFLCRFIPNEFSGERDKPIPLLFGKIAYRNRIHLNAGMINLALIGIKNPEIKERIMVKYAQGRKRKKRGKVKTTSFLVDDPEFKLFKN